MATESQAQKWILDCDGSFRDVTFTPTSKDAIVAFVKYLLPRYVVSSALDNNGGDRASQLQGNDPLQGIDGYIHIVFKDGHGLISQLQLFIDEDCELRRHCAEVSFHPGDIDARTFRLHDFRALIEEWNTLLQSDDYFVRYENASWKLYDHDGLGMIYSRHRPPSVA